MAIDVQRDRVLDSVVGRVAVDVVDLQRHVFPAAVGAAVPMGREHPRPEPHKLAATGRPVDPNAGRRCAHRCLGWAPAHRRTDRRAPFPSSSVPLLPLVDRFVSRPSALRARPTNRTAAARPLTRDSGLASQPITWKTKSIFVPAGLWNFIEFHLTTRVPIRARAAGDREDAVTSVEERAPGP